MQFKYKTAQPEEFLPPDPGVQALLLAGGEAPVIGEKELARAVEILTRYKQGKANLERRVVEDELWWELRHWDAVQDRERRQALRGPEPASAWLFNAIANKHADAMDNYPEPVVLPREPGDAESAKVLSAVLPVILEYNEFEQTYSHNWWEKLKHGTAPYGVFWDPRKDNGLGDVDIREIDLLKLFWEPGVTDLQKSRNLFIVDLVDEDLLEQQYPQHRGRLGGKSIDLKQYLYDDTVDTQGKSLVVDWYYKTRGASGAPLLQYVKFVGDTVLFSSEDCRAPDGTYPYRETGWYEDGEYPVVLDTLFPEKGTPVGFGYVAVCKDPQLYIDKLFGNILDYSMKATRPRAFVSQSTGVNEEEYLDWNKPLVHVEGELDERRLKQITLSGLDGVYVNVLQMKIEEMKDTASNRDVNAGSASGGVTAASAIAALQEAGSKVSRDMIAASYRAYCRINALCISRMRQFYDEARAFRITGSDGGWRFVDFSNRAIRDQPLAGEGAGETLYRRPVFDLKIRSRKRSPFSRMEQNEQAKELYKLGFFDPQRAQEALAALDMMDFEGVDAVRERVREGKSLLDLLEQMSRSLAALTGGAGEQPAASAPAAASDAGQSAGGGRSPVPAPPTESYAAGLARRTAAGAGET